MRTLYRVILTVLALTALFLLISPYLIGCITQKQFNNQIQTLNQQSSYITITPDHYQRHWFSSTTHLLIDIHSPKGSATLFHKTLAVNTIIKHGPFINVNSALHFAKGALIIQGTTPDFQGSLVYVIDWANHLIASAHIPLLKFSDSNGNTYTAQSIQFETSIPMVNQITHSLTLRNLCILTAAKQPTTLDFDNIMITNSRHQDKGVWLGTADVFVGTTSLTNDSTNISIGTLNKLTFNAFSSLNKDQTKLNSLFDLTIQSATFMNKTVEPITLSYGIQNINIDNYKSFMTALEQAKSNGLTNASSTQDAAILNSLAHIFESGFTMTINRFYMGLPKEIASSPVSMHAEIIFNPMDKLAAEGLSPTSATTFMNMAPLLATTLIKTMNIHAALSLPQNLVKEGLILHYATLLSNTPTKQEASTSTQTPETLGDAAYNYLVTNHMLIPNNDGSLQITLTFDKNGALVNGQKPALQLPMPITTTRGTS